LDPPQAVAELLRRHRAALEAAAAETARAQGRAESLAAAVGLALATKQAAMDPQEFRVLGDLLVDQGIEVITHVGEPLTAELEESADILSWEEDGSPLGPGDWVSEAFEPEIRFEGRLARRAKLICARGAEAEPEPEPGADAPQAAEAAQTAEAAEAAGAEEAPGAAEAAWPEAASQPEPAASEPAAPPARRPGRWRRAWAALTGRDATEDTNQEAATEGEAP
jgi:hypothetical protein